MKKTLLILSMISTFISCSENNEASLNGMENDTTTFEQSYTPLDSMAIIDSIASASIDSVSIDSSFVGI